MALIVDDEPINVIMIRAQLKMLEVSSDSTIKSKKVIEIVKNRISKAERGDA